MSKVHLLSEDNMRLYLSRSGEIHVPAATRQSAENEVKTVKKRNTGYIN